MFLRAGAVLGCLLFLAACGGGGGVTNPTEPPVTPEGYSVTAVVFYDQNGDGTLAAAETARIPGVVIEVDGKTGRTEAATGRATITGVSSGTHTVQIRTGSLPPFYQSPAPTTVQVPQTAGQELRLGVTLTIGANRPNTYMAFGDSITVGNGSTDGTGYRSLLQRHLEEHLVRAEVLDRGADGTNSSEGAERIGRGLRSLQPAYTLILYGVNDWNNLNCRLNAGFPCFTIDSLRQIVDVCKSAQSLPVLATIPPGNPSRAEVPPERDEWVREMNNLIRPLAREEGAVLADIETAFRAHGDLSALFSDHIHPNDRGYQIIADTFFDAITDPVNPNALRTSSVGLLAPALMPGLAHPPDRSPRPQPARRNLPRR